jgi:Rieske Fe-S protein
VLVGGTTACIGACLGTACGRHDGTPPPSDAGLAPDANDVTADASVSLDAGGSVDAGPTDGGLVDAGALDAGPPDAGGGCGGLAMGLASAITVGLPVLGDEFFLVRDARGLFAVSALCTHQGCAMNAVGGLFECPCHDSRFSFDGERLAGPARLPLDHLQVCLDAQGRVFVDKRVRVDPATRA